MQLGKRWKDQLIGSNKEEECDGVERGQLPRVGTRPLCLTDLESSFDDTPEYLSAVFECVQYQGFHQALCHTYRV